MRVLLAVPFLAATALQAQAQGYMVTHTTGTFNSIASSGMLLTPSGADDGYAEIPSAFAFEFWGTPVATGDFIYPSTNGLVAVGLASTAYDNISMPSMSDPNGFVGAFWDDLSIAGATDFIYAAVQGSSGSRVQILEWHLTQLSSAVDTIAFQVRVYEGSNVIEIVYGPSTNGAGWSGTIGLESPLGDLAYSEPCSPACTAADVPAGTVIRYTPDATTPTSFDLQCQASYTLPATMQAGSVHSFNWDVINNGPDSSPPTSIAVFASNEVGPTLTELGRAAVPVVLFGQPFSGTISFTAPGGNGTYQIGMIVDPDGLLAETSETNNIIVFGNVLIEGSGGSIDITTQTLPDAVVGEAYSAQLQQTGGVSPTWALDSGSLPVGLTLSASGLISGTPTSEESASFTVLASEAGLDSDTQLLFMSVVAADTLRVTTASLPDGLVGTAYTAMLAAAGGTAPYSFSVLTGAPSWLTLATTGAITGTPNATGAHTVLVQVEDSLGQTAQATLTFDVADPAAVRITNPDTISVRVNSDARVALLAQGGTPPYTWSLVQGTLQAGLTIDPTGFITGRATTVSTATVTLAVVDMAGGSDTASVFVKTENRAAPGGGAGGGRDRSSGCGCRAGEGEGASSGLMWFALLGLAVFLRRAR